MRARFRQATVAVSIAWVLAATAVSARDVKRHGSIGHHRLLIQVDQNDPAVMNLALNNAANVIAYYRSKGEDVDVDVVTYGPGLHMLRADT